MVIALLNHTMCMKRSEPIINRMTSVLLSQSQEGMLVDAVLYSRLELRLVGTRAHASGY